MLKLISASEFATCTCENAIGTLIIGLVSKSNLINIYKIKQLKPDINMKVYAFFDNGDRICINRSYKKAFNEYLRKMRRINQ